MTQQWITEFQTQKWLTQQRNTDFHTSTFYHQKSWVSFLYRSLFSCNNATQILKRTYKILGKKAKKGWRNNATLIFERIYEIFWKNLRKGWKGWRNNATLIFTHSTFYHQKSWDSFLYLSLLWCNNATQNLKRTYEILEKKLKRGDATTQHWFSNTYIIFF